MNSLPRICAALSLAALAAAPAYADSARLMVRSPGTGPAVWLDADGWRLESGDRSAALALPAGAAPWRAAALERGGVLNGTQSAGERRERFVLADAGGGAAALPAPPRPIARLRDQPVPLVSGGELRGLVWLEGESRESYGLRVATWSGGAFGDPVEIAPPGPGSQLAPTVAALEDGRFLLVWAGFDGTDDEIWASVGSAESWSRPVRIAPDDAVPGITPDIVAVPGGALVAWSQYDGSEYRVALARFDGVGFAPLEASGPRGSLFPTFESGGESPRLLWRDAAGDGWVLVELERGAALVERARLAGPGDERPGVETVDGRPTLRFPSTSATRPWR